MILGSALDIMQAGRPPRARFLNYPLGFESGRFRDPVDQLKVVREALQGFEEQNQPGILPMEYEWIEGWDIVNQREQGKLDSRSPRSTEPQYQNEADRIAAQLTLRDDQKQ